MSIIKHFLSALVAMAACFSVLTSHANTVNERDKLSNSTNPSIHWELTWTVEEWVGDYKPYKEIRREIDQALEKNTPDQILAIYREKAQSSSHDPVAIYGWAYVALKADAAQTRNVDGLQRLAGVYEALKITASPKNAEYARVKFLIERRIGSWRRSSQVLVAGKRLIQHDPKDWEVKQNSVELLYIQEDRNEKQLAVKYAQEVVEARPDDANAHKTLAAAYSYYWIPSEGAEYADKAIASYRRYLQLAPKDAEGRARVEKNIEVIEGAKSRQDK